MGKSSLMKQTEKVLLITTAPLAFPNKLQKEKFPGSKNLNLSEHGKHISEKIRKEVNHSPLIPKSENENALDRFLKEYQPQHENIYRALAVMDRREMVNRRTEELSNKGCEIGNIPAILTVQNNAWHYQTESEAWAGLAVCITKAIEETMDTAQKTRTCWRYAWEKRAGKTTCVLFLPCFIVLVLAGLIAWAAWVLLSLAEHKELLRLRFGCIAVTVLAVIWTAFRQLFLVLKPISKQVMMYVSLPDHTGKLGYQQKVIDDINFLKEQIGEKPSSFWKFMTFKWWCCNCSVLYNDNVKDTQIPKFLPASKNELRIIVFVDDLDGCQDKIILKVLSAVNLVLAACEINVILGIDKKMLARAVANGYKYNNNREREVDLMDWAERYINKIVQLPLALPDPNDRELKRFLDQDEDKER